MFKCDCIEKVERDTIAHLKTKFPDRKYQEDLDKGNGEGLKNQAIIFGEKGGRTLYFEFSIFSTFQKANGEPSKPKRETYNINPTFCPFCGIKREE